MNLKQRGYCVGFLLIYTITTIILPTGSRCAVHLPRPDSSLASHHDTDSFLKTKSLRKLLNFDSRLKESLVDPKNALIRDRAKTESSKAMSELPFKSKTAQTLTNKSFRNRNKAEKKIGKWMDSPNEDCNEGKIQHIIRGKFTITGQLTTNIPTVGYQSDSALSVQAKEDQQKVKVQQTRGSEEIWLRLQPEVECGDEAMTLTVRRRRAVQLLLHRDNDSSVPLSQLPPQCGYSVQTSWKDLSLMAKYDACHVTQEDDHYVLPLLWRGTPVKMSCPSSPIKSQVTGLPFLCCSPYSLTVKVQGLTDTEGLRVNVRGEWTPLVMLAEQCGYTLDQHDDEIIIAAPYLSCGITVKDGKHRLPLQIGEKMFTLACPISQTPILQPLFDIPKQQTEQPESQQPRAWAPPFYLAPPFYPHPTYHYTNPPSDAKHPPTPSSPAAQTTFSTQPPPSADYQAYYSHQTHLKPYFHSFGAHISPPATDREEDSRNEHPYVQKKQEMQAEMHTAGDFLPSETHHPTSDAPPLQPLSYGAFSPYYHYYHHPKIPLPGPTKDPDPGPDEPKEPPHPDFAPSPRSVKPFEASPLPSTPSESPEFTYKTSEHHPPHPLPYPYYYFYYFPHIAKDEARLSAPLSPKKDDRSSKSGSFLLENKLNPNKDNPNPNEMMQFGSKSAEVHEKKEENVDVNNKDVATNSTSYAAAPSPNHYPPFYPFYLHPYYFYQLVYGAENSPSSHSHEPPTSPKQDLGPIHKSTSSPPLQTSNPTTPPPTKPLHNIHNVHQHPYYYYNLYDQPEVSANEYEPNPAGEVDSMSRSLPSSDYSGMGASLPSMHQPPYAYHLIQQHPYSALGHSDEDEVLDDEMRDQLKMDLYNPSTSPCDHDRESDLVCNSSLGCCWYPMNDCTLGQYFLFLVPDSEMEPSAVSPVPLSEVFDQTSAHPSEDHGLHCLHQDHRAESEDSLIRSFQ
ncbi:uncharacterized protein LOC121503791 [Cheilinus undulatus]|uniref:uncharacterized protein LOC121503791 n=1 Tax=Cheilinus undulatus TaxID=241271 RepID=UPI001BD23909|nr:uncharacterized protein LOC121503791 [Cheilinus undulatus]